MAVNLTPNNNFSKPKFVKNLVRTVSTMGKEIFSEYMPETVKIYDTNKDFAKKIKANNNMKISLKDITSNDVYKSGKQLIANAVEDLKTGNFFNEDRINKNMEAAASEMFGIDFSFLNSLDSDKDSINNDIKTETREINGNKVTVTTNRSTLVINDNMNAINMSFKSIAKVISKNQNIAFNNLNRNFNEMLLFKTETTLKFYNSMSNQFMQINNTINTFYRNAEKLTKIELGGLKESNTFNQLNILLGSSELLSLGYYIDKLKPTGFNKSALSPIMNGIKHALMFAMPPVVKDTLAETNKIIKNLPIMLNQKFGDMKNSDNSLSQLIGGTFHKDLNDGKSNYKIKNQAVGFDGITRRAIVNVIPSLISKIINAMRKGNDSDELVYDYQAGAYRTKGDIKKASEMQFQQQIRGTAGFESDIEKYKNKVMSNVAASLGVDKNSKKTRREIDKSIYKMLKNKELPIKGGKYSKNDKINEAIIETFLKMTPLEKVDFVNAVTRLTTPQEWLEQNESYHNIFDPLGYDDIKKKYDKDHREELYLYFKSKGMDTLADHVREGDAYNRSENKLSKLNPFYYIVEGLRAGNDLITKTLLSDPDDNIDKNSFIGKLNQKINYILSKPLSEHIQDLSKKFKQRIGKNPFIEEIKNAGLVTGIKGLFKEASQYIKGGNLNNNGSNKSKLVDKLKEDFIDPIIKIFKHAVTDPIKKQASQIGDFAKNVFSTITEPVKRVFNEYKTKYNTLKVQNTVANSYVSRAKTENELKTNENQASKEITDEFKKNEEKYTELDKSVSRGILDMVKSIRTDLVSPIDAFTTSIALVLKDGDAFVSKMNDFKFKLDTDHENLKAHVMDIDDQNSAENINNRLIEYQKLSTEIQDLIFNIESALNQAKSGEDDDEDDDDDTKNPTIEKVTGVLKKGITKGKNVLEKIKDKLTDQGSKTPIIDSFKKLGNKTVSTITGVIGDMMNNISRTSGAVSNILANVLSVSQDFFANTFPNLLKTAGAEIKNVATTALEELKNTGSDVWEELKNTGSKIWTNAKNIFSTIGNQIFDFLGKVRQQEFDVYIEGGTLTGIHNTVYYIKPKKSGYQYMKNKFKQEDADDAEDTDESNENSKEAKETITQRIKNRFKFMGDIIKSVASTALNAVVSGVKNLASSLLSTIGTTILSVIGPKLGSVLKKYGGKTINWARNTIGKAKNRTKKGKKNLSKILGKAGSAASVANGLLSDSTPVYVVGGILDGVGNGIVDDVVDDVVDDIIDDVDDKLKKEAAEEVSEEALEKMAREAAEHSDDAGKGLGKISKWFGDTKLGKLIGGTALGKKIKSLTSKSGKKTGWISKLKKSLGVSDDIADATKSSKFLQKLLGMTTKSGGSIMDIMKSIGAGKLAGLLDGFSLLKSGKLVKAGGKLLPIVGDIASIIDIGSDIWKAFTSETFGKKVGSAISAILKVGVEALDIVTGDTGLVSIVGGLLAEWLTDKIANGIDKLLSKFGFGKKKKDKDKEEESKISQNNVSMNPDENSAFIDTTSNPVNALSQNAAPDTQIAVKTSSAKEYRDFKQDEADKEAKFLARLSQSERDEYLSNKNASVYSSILRSQDGGKMVRTLMNTAILASSMNAGMTEGDIMALLNNSLVKAIKTNVVDDGVHGDGIYGTLWGTYGNNGNDGGGGSGGGGGGSDGGGGGGGGTSPTPGEDVSKETNVTSAVWKFFTSRGYSPAATAGIMGNLQQESGMNPSRYQSGGGPGRGIAQWTVSEERFKGLKAHAASKGKDWTDLQSQLEWLEMELNGKDPTTSSILKKQFGGLENFKKATDYKWAVQAFEKSFERAGKPMWEKRYNYAQSFYDKFSSSAVSMDNTSNSILNLLGNMPIPEGALSTSDATLTGRFATSMDTSLANVNTISENINVINNTPLNNPVTLKSSLDEAIYLLNNINNNMEKSINKEVVVEKTQNDTKLDNSKNPFVDFTDNNIDLSLRSFSIDIKAILEGI